MAKEDNREQMQRDEQQRNAQQQNQPQSSQSRTLSRSGERSSGLSRRGQYYPSLFSLSPGELFNASPFELMRRFSDEMDQAFSDFGLSSWSPGAVSGTGRGAGQITTWSPAIEVFQRQNELVVRADLPGCNKDDVKVEMTDDGLVIQGERKEEHEENRQGYFRSERSYGQFYRLIPLPEEVEPDQIRANFNNGVLEITVPLPQKQERRREISIGGETGQRQSAEGQQAPGQSQAASRNQ